MLVSTSKGMFAGEKMLPTVMSRSFWKKLGHSSVVFQFLFFEGMYKDSSCVQTIFLFLHLNIIVGS